MAGQPQDRWPAGRWPTRSVRERAGAAFSETISAILEPLHLCAPASSAVAPAHPRPPCMHSLCMALCLFFTLCFPCINYVLNNLNSILIIVPKNFMHCLPYCIVLSCVCFLHLFSTSFIAFLFTLSIVGVIALVSIFSNSGVACSVAGQPQDRWPAGRWPTRSVRERAGAAFSETISAILEPLHLCAPASSAVAQSPGVLRPS